MKTYGMHAGKYMDMWDSMETSKDRSITHEVLDRWLSIFYGLQADGDERDDNNCFPFIVRDEKKLTMFLLRYS